MGLHAPAADTDLLQLGWNSSAWGERVRADGTSVPAPPSLSPGNFPSLCSFRGRFWLNWVILWLFCHNISTQEAAQGAAVRCIKNKTFQAFVLLDQFWLQITKIIHNILLTNTKITKPSNCHHIIHTREYPSVLYSKAACQSTGKISFHPK